MTETMKDNLFYVCSLIEFIARETKNQRRVIANALGIEGIKKQLADAPVNHCLSFEQVADELIVQYQIPQGNFDTITNCKYDVPTYLSIGRLYAIMIEDCAEEGNEINELIQLFNSFISDEISNFSTDLYYQNPSYLECSYQEGRLLD